MNFYNTEENSNKKDFVITFAALIIGVGFFSSRLELVLVNFGFMTLNLFDISIVVLVFLFLSIYLYAIDYARYGLNSMAGWKIFKALRRIADISYLVFLVLPLLILLFWFLAFLFNKIPIAYIQKYLKVGAIVWSSSIFSGLIYFLFIKLIKKDKIIRNDISRQASISLLEINKLVTKRDWRLVVIESFRLIELMFKDKAEEMGIETNHFPFIQQLRVFLKKDFITEDQFYKIYKAREIRNKAVHSIESITEKEALSLVDIVVDISKNLTSATFASSPYEEKVFNALLKIFPKHHIFHQFGIGDNKRSDFIADGPNYRYFIEVKDSKSKPYITKAITKLELLLNNSSERGLLAVPSRLKVKIDKPNIRIAYFDVENGRFSNLNEIMSWVYGEN